MGKAINLQEIINSPLNKERQEVSAKTLANAMNGKKEEFKMEYEFPERPCDRGSMKVHIEIYKFDKGTTLDITADIDNQEDLGYFMEKNRGYMPRKKFLGLF